LRTARDVGNEALHDRKALRGRTRSWIKRWLAKVFSVRGGGLYAVGYIVCFVFFEIQMVVGEIVESSGVADFVKSQVGEFFFRFFTETIVNMVRSFIWPVYVVALYPPYGAIGLGLAFWLFPIYLKKPIENWLMDGAQPAEEKAAQD